MAPKAPARDAGACRAARQGPASWAAIGLPGRTGQRKAPNGRAGHPVGEGPAERTAGGVRQGKDLLGPLRTRELRRIGTRLAEESGIPCRETREGERVAGTCRRAVQLMSGKHALIEKSHEFTLVPWREVLEHSHGREVSGIVKGGSISWELGQKRSGPAIS